MTIVEPSQNPNKTDADAAWEKETTDAVNALQSQIQNLGSGVVSGNKVVIRNRITTPRPARALPASAFRSRRPGAPLRAPSIAPTAAAPACWRGTP